MDFKKLSQKEEEEILEILKSSKEGLKEEEVAERRKIYGLNEIKEVRLSGFKIFLKQFKSVFFYLLFFAGILNFLIGEKIDGILIFIFAFFNIILGFIQEFRAERALSFLKSFFPPDTNVLRNGKEMVVDKKFLVPGDIVVLETGDVVPADLRILEAKNLLIDESILTGESKPQEKFSQSLKKEIETIFEVKNILFSGTSLVSGKAKGIVFLTGERTQIGKIGKGIFQIEKPNFYEKEIKDFSRLILKFVFFTVSLIFLINLIIKKGTNINDFFIFCIALFVGIVPEALPLITSFSLSRGALKLAKRNVLVKRLMAIEDLGNVEILCTDKTGTITENKLTIEKIFSENPEKCLNFAYFASSLIEKGLVKNPFDLAILEKIEKKKKARLISEIPFSPQRMRNSVLVESEGKKFLIVRGAPEKILELSHEIKSQKEEIFEMTKKEGKEGKRILAIGYKEFNKNDYNEEDEKNLEFLGLISFIDQLKKDAKSTINLAEKLGLKIKILTGDSKEVSGYIGKEVGLIKNENEVILGKDLECLSEEEFDNLCEKKSVFARLLPEMKLKIIKSLQKKQEVGFIGEGINDCLALKRANIAIAVRGAAEISKECSDIILLKDDLKTIVEGIRIGRNIFLNIQKYIKITLSNNFGNMYSMATISLLFPFLPMLPTQILLLNLLSDLPLIVVATDSIDIKELKRPKIYNFSQIFPFIFFLSVVNSFFDFVFFAIFYSYGERMIQTLWFIFSLFTEIAIIFSVRTRKFFILGKPPSRPLFFISFFVIVLTILLPLSSIGQKTFHFAQPIYSFLLILISLSLAYLLVNEALKQIYFKHFEKKFYSS